MYNYDKNLVPRARELRTNATRQENHLWYDFLNRYPVRCHRQKIIGEYIVDFYCPQVKVIIELDGKHHLEKNQAEYDAERTAPARRNAAMRHLKPPSFARGVAEGRGVRYEKIS